MQIKNIQTKQEFEEFTNELIGDGKDCEKNLFTALYLFLKDFCPTDELDLEHILSLVLSTKMPRGLRNPQSDVDKIFEMVAIVNPTASCLVYYNAFKLYPEGMQNQAAGNLAYKICGRLNGWPKYSIPSSHNFSELNKKPVDKWMEKNKNTIVMGDWGQIQPVATDTDKMLLKEFYPNAKGLYAFQSTMWEKMNFRKITLTKIYRQDNLELVEKLHAIKYGNLDAVKWFNDNASQFFITDGVTICPTNKLVEKYNHDAWSMFSDSYMEEYCPTIISGTLSEIPQHHQSLQLAVRMRVMTTSNGKNYKNGSMGTVTKLNKKSIRVELDNGNVVTVTAQRLELENGVIYKQLPVVLGYAITCYSLWLKLP